MALVGRVASKYWKNTRNTSISTDQKTASSRFYIFQKYSSYIFEYLLYFKPLFYFICNFTNNSLHTTRTEPPTRHACTRTNTLTHPLLLVVLIHWPHILRFPIHRPFFADSLKKGSWYLCSRKTIKNTQSDLIC